MESFEVRLSRYGNLGKIMFGIFRMNFYCFRMPVGLVAWKEQSILVMDEVLINTPYHSENCVLSDQSNPNSQCLVYVKKTVYALVSYFQ